MNYKILFITFLSVFSGIQNIYGNKKNDMEESTLCYAQQKKAYYNAVHNRLITAKTILSLVPRIPSELEPLIKRWLEENKSLLQKLSSFYHFPDAKTQGEEDNKLMQEHGFTNLSGHKISYIAFMAAQESDNPLASYLFKIGGGGHRIRNMLSYRGEIESKLWTDSNYYNERVKALEEELGKIPTYQTASRLGYNLVLRQWIEEKNLTKIRIPEAYLVPLSDKYVDDETGKDSNYSDEHCLVIERKFENITKVEPGSERANNLPDETVRQLFEAMVGGGLWDIRTNLFVDEEDNICLLDLEQPNNSNPAVFFCQDPKKYAHNTQCGIQQLLKEVFTDYKKKLLIKECFDQHPILQQWVKEGFFQDIKKELEALLEEADILEATDE